MRYEQLQLTVLVFTQSFSFDTNMNANVCMNLQARRQRLVKYYVNKNFLSPDV